MKEKVLIIGGSGFLGSHLADALSDQGFYSVIYDKNSSPWLREDQELVVGDIMDEGALSEAMAGAKYVYHLAGIADINEAVSNPPQTIQSNIIGSMNVIEACLKNKVKRLLYASTIYVYSQKGSFYRVSKQAVELLLESYYENFGLEYTILRYGSLYGPRAQQWNGLKKWTTQAVKNGKIDYPGTGEERREYIHVRDAARLSVKALADDYSTECLTLTGTQVLTSSELIKMIEEILGKKIKTHFVKPQQDSGHYVSVPYRFSPKAAKKIISNEFFDIGQGVLDLIEEVYHENDKDKE